ncbi:hypothetical protein [Thalassospira sp.]
MAQHYDGLSVHTNKFKGDTTWIKLPAAACVAK